MADWLRFKGCIFLSVIEDGLCITEIEKRYFIVNNRKSTYKNTSQTLKIFYEQGLITRERDGRKFIIRLTERGNELKRMLKEVDQEVGK